MPSSGPSPTLDLSQRARADHQLEHLQRTSPIARGTGKSTSHAPLG